MRAWERKYYIDKANIDYFVVVTVFETADQMHEFMTKNKFVPAYNRKAKDFHLNVEACFCPGGDDDWKKGVVGQIIMHWGSFRRRVIIHECVHAGLHFGDLYCKHQTVRAMPKRRRDAYKQECISKAVESLADQMIASWEKGRRK